MFILSTGIVFLVTVILGMTLWGILNFSIWWTEMIVLGDDHLTLALLAVALMIVTATILEWLAARNDGRSHR